MNIPSDLKYTTNDEWIRVESDEQPGTLLVTIGITDYAQDQLSDIVYVEIIVTEDENLNPGDTFATIESVKAAADIYMPVSGKVVAVNEDLPDTPEIVNSDPYGEAWLIKIHLSDPTELDGLLDHTAYETSIQLREL